MDAIDLPEDVMVELARIGAADVAVGLVTAGPGSELAGVAAAIKAGLDARLSGQSAILIQAFFLQQRRRSPRLWEAPPLRGLAQRRGYGHPTRCLLAQRQRRHLHVCV